MFLYTKNKTYNCVLRYCNVPWSASLYSEFGVGPSALCCRTLTSYKLCETLATGWPTYRFPKSCSLSASTGFNRTSVNAKNMNLNDDALSEAITRSKRDSEKSRLRRTGPIFSPFPSFVLAKVKDINAVVAKFSDHFISELSSNVCTWKYLDIFKTFCLQWYKKNYLISFSVFSFLYKFC